MSFENNDSYFWKYFFWIYLSRVYMLTLAVALQLIAFATWSKATTITLQEIVDSATQV